MSAALITPESEPLRDTCHRDQALKIASNVMGSLWLLVGAAILGVWVFVPSSPDMGPIFQAIATAIGVMLGGSLGFIGIVLELARSKFNKSLSNESLIRIAVHAIPVIAAVVCLFTITHIQ